MIDLANRSILYIVPLVSHPPAKIDVFSHRKVFSKTPYLGKESFTYKKVAGGNIKERPFFARAPVSGTHLQ
jgi:hypothetical protein